MEPTRQDLCHAALNGDADAFEELIHETSNTLYAVAFALLQNREEARDVVQDTYVRVWNKRQRIREADKLVPFLITTTRNRAHDLMRRRKFRSDQPVDQENEPDSGPGPDGTLSAEERHATIREGLRALPEKYRVASLLSAGADYEYTPGSGGAFGGEATKDIVGEAEAFMVQTDPADTAPVSKAQSANRRNLESELLESNGEARRDRSDLAGENEPVPESPAPNRRLITNVRIEYEVESYQAAADAIELRLDQAYESKIERTATSGSGETGTDKTEQDKTVFEIRLRSESQPAERVHLIVRTEQVATQLQALKALANSSNFDIRQSNYQRAANDSQSAILVVRMPENDSTAFVDQVHKTGKVESFTVQRNEHPGLEGAPAEIVVNLTSQGRIITDENSLGAVLRLTFGQAVSAISWSVRMIGVAIAFLLPWAAAATAAWLLFRAIHKRRGSSGK